MSSSREADPGCECGTPSSGKRLFENRYAKTFESVMALLASNEMVAAEIAQRFPNWSQPKFKDGVLTGLMAADHLYAHHVHYYHPIAKINVHGGTEHTAMSKLLEHFPRSLGRRYDGESEAIVGRELGIALHFMIDLSRPLHAAVVEGGVFRHSGFESLENTYRDRFHAPPGEDIRYFGGSLPAAHNVANLAQMLAEHSLRIYQTKIQQVLPDIPVWGTWSPEQAEPALREALPFGQKAMAAFLYAWFIGFDRLIEAVYEVYLQRDPDTGGKTTYRRHFVGRGTLREMIAEVAGSDEFYNKFVKGWNRETAGKALPALFLYRTGSLFPGETAAVSRPDWQQMVKAVLYGAEYDRNFGDRQLPGPISR